MGANLTDNQRKWLQSLVDGQPSLPIRPFSSLRDLGFVVKADGQSGQRGYTNASITDAGRAALA